MTVNFNHQHLMFRTIVIAVKVDCSVASPAEPEDVAARLAARLDQAVQRELKLIGVQFYPPTRFHVDIQPNTVYVLVENHQLNAQLPPPGL